jgi:hypothetical protein
VFWAQARFSDRPDIRARGALATFVQLLSADINFTPLPYRRSGPFEGSRQLLGYGDRTPNIIGCVQTEGTRK